jgi:hypothetical protein
LAHTSSDKTVQKHKNSGTHSPGSLLWNQQPETRSSSNAISGLTKQREPIPRKPVLPIRLAIRPLRRSKHQTVQDKEICFTATIREADLRAHGANRVEC